MMRYANSKVRIIASFKAKKGLGSKLQQVIEDITILTRAEQGNISYIPHKKIDSNDEFMIDEIWKDIHSIKKHFEQDYIANLGARLSHILEKPIDIQWYLEVDVKTAC